MPETITIAELATAPQLDSLRNARDLILWLRSQGWVIVPVSEIEADPVTFPGLVPGVTYV